MGAECVGGETPIPDSIKSVYESDRRKWKLQRQEEGALASLSHARSLTHCLLLSLRSPSAAVEFN